MANTERIQKMIEHLGSSEAKFARKTINYYDGKQVEELTDFLNSAQSFRKNWREKGLVPRVRNITKAIVDKSGLLFNGAEPVLEVWTDAESVNAVASEQLKDLMDKASWVEFFSNLDNQVRLLKSSMVLVQRDPENNIIFDALHRGNCVASVDPNTRQLTELLVHTSQMGEKIDTFRHFTDETITDYSYNPEVKELMIDAEYENPYGIIPAAPFHDTQLPRYGLWNIAPRDLIGLNEMYNLHLTDTEYSAAWAKVKTLFTNARIDGSGDSTETYVDPATGIPRQVPSQPSTVGGPGRIVVVDAGADSVYLEYKGPDVSLDPIEQIFSNWVHDFAADWAVRLQTAGDGTASSGFQLIVEELPNMELRKQRQKMFNAGFARLYKVLTFVTAGMPGVNLPPEGQLFVTWQAPALPTDDKAVEEVWSRRIMEGRASRVDYFMEVKGMNREEAVQKVAEIDAFNAIRPAAPTRTSEVRVV